MEIVCVLISTSMLKRESTTAFKTTLNSIHWANFIPQANPIPWVTNKHVNKNLAFHKYFARIREPIMPNHGKCTMFRAQIRLRLMYDNQLTLSLTNHWYSSVFVYSLAKHHTNTNCSVCCDEQKEEQLKARGIQGEYLKAIVHTFSRFIIFSSASIETDKLWMSRLANIFA